MGVIIGVDPHKASCTAAVLDERGELVDQQRFASTRTGSRALGRWAKRWPERRWAVEGASGLGRRLAQQLATGGEHVVDVPAKLAARVLVLSVGHGRKSDAHDAVSVAVAALGTRRLGERGPPRGPRQRAAPAVGPPRRPGPGRTQALNRLHVLLADLVPSGAKRNLDADAAAALLRRLRPATAPARTRRQLAVDLVADLRSLDRRIAAAEERLRAAVTRSATTLVELFGVGPILAAKLLGEVGDVRRFPTKHHFAAHTGTAPIEASSGEVVRHRLSRAGNRKLNHALHLMAIVQVRHPTAGQAYYRRKLAEGKSRKEALRCLKRRLSDAVYRQLLADQQRPAQVQP
jgi:transposase